MNKRLYQYTTCLLLSAGLTLPLQADEFEISSGVDYSSGDYGGEVDTDILFVPVTLGYSSSPWKAQVTIPWIQIQGPGNVVGGGDAGVIVGDEPSQTTTTESGLGDIWGSLRYNVEAIPYEWFYMDAVAKVKFPTADEDRGLGTGEFDYTLQLDFFKPLGQLTPMATVAYKVKGDPDAYSLDNVFYLSVGADYRLNDSTNFGATLDYQEASTSTSDDALEIFSYLSHSINDDWDITGYTYFGLSDGSPDAGGGISVGYTF